MTANDLFVCLAVGWLLGFFGSLLLFPLIGWWFLAVVCPIGFILCFFIPNKL